MNNRFQALVNEASALVASGRASREDLIHCLSGLRGRIDALSLASAPGDADALSKSLNSESASMAALVADMDRSPSPSPSQRAEFAQRLAVIDQIGAALWEHLRASTLNIDRIDYAVRTDDAGNQYATSSGRLAESFDPFEEAIAALGHSVREAAKRLGLTPAPLSGAAAGLTTAARLEILLRDPFDPANEGPDRIGFYPKLIAKAGANQKLTGLAGVPLAAAARPRELPKIDGFGREDAYPDQTEAVRRMREAGSTYVIGDPAGRAKYIFKQSGETCGIAAQVIVLMEAGLVGTDAASTKAAEERLFKAAVERGYFEDRRDNGGTPAQFIGDLLPMPVMKGYESPPSDLFSAVSKGKMVIVLTDAGKLYDDSTYDGVGHIVVITGAEVDRATNVPLGYYINDTLTGDAARFVTTGQFLDAWNSFYASFMAPQL